MPEKPLVRDLRRSNLIIPALALLLVVGLSRMVRISEFDLDQHENYAISQAHGTLEEIMRWTPYDWGASSFLVLGGWQALVGSDPIVLRYLSVLLFIFGSACVYAVTRSMVGRQAAPLAVLVYAAPVALILLSLFTRGYAILIALLPFSLLIAERYTRRPTLVSGALLAEMIAWEPGQIYAEERTIGIPPLTRVATGNNRLDAMLIVYQWWDGVRVAAPGVDAETRLPLVSVDVRSF